MKECVVVALTLLAMVGCTNRETYDSLQGARENECRQIADANERDLCFANARESYNKYEQQRNQSSDK